MYKSCFDCGFGYVEVCADNQFVTEIRFTDRIDFDNLNDNDVTSNAVDRLMEYFMGKRQTFDIPYRFDEGTDFQRRVWQELCNIPYGETVSYGDIAAAVGNERAVRAVGAAIGKNPISIVVPCHRVIGKDGSITGYAGGVDKKQHLLDLERSVKEKNNG